MKRYQGETYSQYVYFLDQNNNPLDPDNIVVTVYKPDNTTETISLSKIETGKYELNYNIADNAPVGNWKIIIVAKVGMWTAKEKLTFEVMSV